MKVFEHNKEILKPYRKYMVMLREVLGIEASDDEKDTIHNVYKATIAMLKFIQKSCSNENQKSKKKKTSENQKKTSKPKSIEELSKNLLNKF